MATQYSILAWRIPWTEKLATVRGVTKSRTRLIMHRCSLVYLAPLIQHDLKFIYKMHNVKTWCILGYSWRKGRWGRQEAELGRTITSISSETSAFIMLFSPHFPFCSRHISHIPPPTPQQSSAIFLKNYHGKAFLILTDLGHFRIIVSAWILEGLMSTQILGFFFLWFLS